MVLTMHLAMPRTEAIRLWPRIVSEVLPLSVEHLTPDGIKDASEALARAGIRHHVLDGPPQALGPCVICGTAQVRHWTPYDLFFEDDDQMKYGGQPLCLRCWKHVPIERVMQGVLRPSIWERLAGDDDS